MKMNILINIFIAFKIELVQARSIFSCTMQFRSYFIAFNSFIFILYNREEVLICDCEGDVVKKFFYVELCFIVFYIFKSLINLCHA